MSTLIYITRIAKASNSLMFIHVYPNCENQLIKEIQNTAVVLFTNKDNAIFSPF